ncbi:hypothetical protein BMS3Bbin04_01970 [bacterium BMS3Bbin04]|nr:hypothetical protein BMS3Bbin04_01970 [bacterium BMS3Bbin04]
MRALHLKIAGVASELWFDYQVVFAVRTRFLGEGVASCQAEHWCAHCLGEVHGAGVVADDEFHPREDSR